MKSILLGVVVATGLLSACGGDSRLFILQNQVPGNGCRVNTDSALYRGEGLMDVSLVSATSPFGYELFPLIQNDYPSTGGGGAPEPNRLFVRAFRVRVEGGDGAPAKLYEFFDKLASAEQTRTLVEFQQPWAATIGPGGGLLAAAVGGVQGELARQLRATRLLDTSPTLPLIIRLRAVARQSGSTTDLESNEFVFPIKACNGCLVGDVRPCPYAPKNVGNACNIAQDATVDCCSAGVELTCPSIAN